MNHNLRYFLFATVGFIAGAFGFALGALIASTDHGGWGNAIYYSAVGIICAPLATLSWATRRLWRSQVFGGISLLGGFLASMAILLDVTMHYETILEAYWRAPFAFAGWFAIWGLWIAIALIRLILFSPEHTRHRLPNRRHDMRPSDTGAT